MTRAFSERETTAADARWIVALFAAPHARPFMQQPSEHDVRTALGHAGCADRIVLDAAGIPAAHWRARMEADWLVEIRTLVSVAPGTGAGSWSLHRALAWAFDEHGVHRAYLYVTAANARARALYERHGLRCEGTERDAFRSPSGTYEDLCVYGILRHEYTSAAPGVPLFPV